MANIQQEQNGLSVQVIAQRVKFEYHSPVVTNRGLGQLADALRAEPRKDNSANSQSPTSSATLLFVPYSGGTYKSEDLARINQDASKLADQFLAFDPTTGQVSTYFETLKALQRAALRGRGQAVIEPQVLSEIEEQMKPYNLGYVWRIKLQARWWYPEKSSGMHACKSGGFSKTVVLRTVYLKGTLFKTSEDAVNYVVKFWGGNLPGVAEVSAAPTKVVFEDRDKYVATRVIPGNTVVAGKSDKEKPYRVEVGKAAVRTSAVQRARQVGKLDLMALADKRRTERSSGSS